MKTLDFTSTYWGHNIIGIHEVPAKTVPEKLRNKLKPFKRWSALLISNKGPDIGDILRLKSDQGVMNAKIVRSEWRHNPRDMYKIEFEYLNTEIES